MQLGTVPDWLAALATPIAVLALLWETRTSRAERKALAAQQKETEAAQAQKERERQVSQVTAWVEETGGTHRDITIAIQNTSDMAIYAVSCGLVGSEPGLPADRRTIRSIAPDSRAKTPTWIAVKLPDDCPIDAVVEFTDAQQIRWRRIGATFTEISDRSATA